MYSELYTPHENCLKALSKFCAKNWNLKIFRWYSADWCKCLWVLLSFRRLPFSSFFWTGLGTGKLSSYRQGLIFCPVWLKQLKFPNSFVPFLNEFNKLNKVVLHYSFVMTAVRRKFTCVDVDFGEDETRNFGRRNEFSAPTSLYEIHTIATITG